MLANQTSTGVGARKIDAFRGGSSSVVSRQWMARPADEKFLSLELLIDFTKARAGRTQEVRTRNNKVEIFAPEIDVRDSRDVALLKTQQLSIGLPDGTEVSPSHWAFGQVAGLAKAPASYLRQLPSPLVADALTYGLRYNRDAEDIKLFADDSTAMAITGPDYGRIYDHEVAEAVSASMLGSTGDHRWKVPGMIDWSTSVYNPHHPVTADTTTLFANDRGLFIFLCQDLAPIEVGKLASGEPDLMFRGVYLTNSEVGAGALKLGAMYLRGVCQNCCLWGVEGLEEMTLRHTKYAPVRFLEEARPALESYGNGSTKKLLEGVAAAKSAVLAKTKDESLNWLAARGQSRKRAAAIYDSIVREEWQGDESDRPVSAWDMAQGITATARDALNFDVRMDLESAAQTLLDRVA